MIAPKRIQRAYDHRLRQFVFTTGDTAHALRIGVPRSTATGWLRPRDQPVISFLPNEQQLESLENELTRLRLQVAKLRHLPRLLFLILRMSGFSFQSFRIPSSDEKSRLIRQIGNSSNVIPLGRLLNVIGLSRSRFHAWKDSDACELADKSSCPRPFPSQLTGSEFDAIRSMVTSSEYRHLSTGAIARFARKVGRVFAAPATWYRLVRRHNWSRPRVRVHPTKPKIGIRATKPNQIWHVDTSLLRLLDGSRVYMHVPHYAFKGQTPDEMFFGTGADVPEQLQIATIKARESRRASNFQVSCNRCRTEPPLVAIPTPTKIT